mmetsp:Transcript_104091/g.333722  ORF Transcript_104091/g.333722 Transcript_104091/m.333722 type:complete len:310 (-) Transcript_104091:191-1120(-)
MARRDHAQGGRVQHRRGALRDDGPAPAVDADPLQPGGRHPLLGCAAGGELVAGQGSYGGCRGAVQDHDEAAEASSADCLELPPLGIPAGGQPVGGADGRSTRHLAKREAVPGEECALQEHRALHGPALAREPVAYGAALVQGPRHRALGSHRAALHERLLAAPQHRCPARGPHRGGDGPRLRRQHQLDRVYGFLHPPRQQRLRADPSRGVPGGGLRRRRTADAERPQQTLPCQLGHRGRAKLVHRPHGTKRVRSRLFPQPGDPELEEAQLRQLAGMGFDDRESCLSVLRRHRGQLSDSAVEELVRLCSS